MFHASCRICYSKYREEIENLLSQRLPFREIARRYQEVFDVKLHDLEQSIGRHYKKHSPRELTLEEKGLLEKVERGDNSSADKLQRIIAAKAVESMLLNPSRIRFNDYIKIQNLLLRKDKMKQKRGWDYSDYEALFSKIR